MEKQYRSEAFRSSALVLVAGATTLGVVSILLDLAYPAKMATPFGLGCLVMAGGRYWLHSLGNQYLASLYFSSAHLAVCISCVIAITTVLVVSEPRQPSPTEVVFMMLMAVMVKSLERLCAADFRVVLLHTSFWSVALLAQAACAPVAIPLAFIAQLAALALGLRIGHSIEGSMRAAFVRSTTSKAAPGMALPAAGASSGGGGALLREEQHPYHHPECEHPVPGRPPSRGACIEPWSLRMSDPELERAFRTAQFGWSYHVTIVCGAFVVVIYAVVALCFASQRYLLYVSPLGVGLLALRHHLSSVSVLQQPHALALFSRVWAAAAVLAAALWLQLRVPLDADAEHQLQIATLLGVAIMLLKVIERLSCIGWEHSLLSSAITLVQLYTSSAELPAVAAYLPVVGLCLGVVFGVTLQHTRRVGVLSGWQAEDADDEVREAAARTHALAEQARAEHLLSLEREVQRKKLGTLADSRLNHLIKGTCGTARTAVELCLLRLQSVKGDTAEQVHQLLHQAVDALGTATEWVDQRQVFVSLEHNIYRSVPIECDITELLGQAIRHSSCDVSVDGVAHVVVDSCVFGIATFEALSNAQKYRAPGTTIGLRVSYNDVDGWPTALRVDITNQNRPGTRCLTDDECERVFESGYRSENATLLSHGIGLSSVRKAVDAAKGRAWLKAASGATTFTLLLPATPVIPQDEGGPSEPLPTSVRRPRTSPARRRPADKPYPIGKAMERGQSSSSAWPQRDTGHDTEEGLALSSQWAAAASSSLLSSIPAATNEPAGGGMAMVRPVCMGLDDDHFPRQCLRMLFNEMLGADVERSLVLGETEEEAGAFVDAVLGNLDAQLCRASPPLPPANIAIIDQNISPTQTTVRSAGARGLPQTGIDIAAELRRRGYGGVICILTGSSEREIERIRSEGLLTGSADLVLPKGSPLKQMAEALRTAWSEHTERRGLIRSS